MAGTVFRSVDKQRFKKIYPAKRFAPIMVLQSEKNMVIETGVLNFTEASGTTSQTYNFTQIYEEVPTVVVGVNSIAGDMVLIKVTQLNNQSVTIEISAPFDGKVDLQIMEIGA